MAAAVLQAARPGLVSPVNNVGHYLRPTAFLESEEAHWEALYGINLLHVFRCSRAFAPSMVERGSGTIVNVASVEGLRSYPSDLGLWRLQGGGGPLHAVPGARAGAQGGAGQRHRALILTRIDRRWTMRRPLGPDQGDLWPIWAPVGRSRAFRLTMRTSSCSLPLRCPAS